MNGSPLNNAQLCIWQQNLQKTDTAQTAMLASTKPEDWDILALQEPFLNHLNKTQASHHWIVHPNTHCNDRASHTRSIILINANIPIDIYSFIDAPLLDVTAIRFKGPNSYLSIFKHLQQLQQQQQCASHHHYSPFIQFPQNMPVRPQPHALAW